MQLHHAGHLLRGGERLTLDMVDWEKKYSIRKNAEDLYKVCGCDGLL